MQAKKTRKDFFLDEDFRAYQAQEEFDKLIDTLSRACQGYDIILSKIRLSAKEIHQTSYSAGYANAEFDAAENS